MRVGCFIIDGELGLCSRDSIFACYVIDMSLLMLMFLSPVCVFGTEEVIGVTDVMDQCCLRIVYVSPINIIGMSVGCGFN